MIQKLRIYSDKSYILPTNQHTVMLYPFWGGTWGDTPKTFNIPEVYNPYIAIGKAFFEMTNLEDADILVAPVAWEQDVNNRELTRQLAEYATPEKPIVIFFWHFEKENVDVPNSMVFRTSFHKSTRQPNEYTMPLWREDYLQTQLNGELILREKQDVPIVGFCGQAILPRMEFIQQVKDIFRTLRYGAKKTQEGREKRFWHVFRGKVLSYIQRGRSIKTNFIARSQFFGEVSKDKQKIYQQEFINNTINSDYVVSIRGTANSSFRLYEVLCFGRIPVFINTDCMLPYEWEIDWKNICVWVDESEIDQIEQKIIEFHNRHSPEEFINLQKRCRQIWEEYLSPQGFFKHFHQHFTSAFPKE